MTWDDEAVVDAGIPSTTDTSEWGELPDSTWSRLDQLARALRLRNPTLETTLAAVVSTALATVPTARHVGIAVLQGSAFAARAASDDLPRRLDELQGATGEGPCLEAARSQTPILLADSEKEDRWPTFTSAAARDGVRSMACCPLYVDDEQLGALSLYAEEPEAFDEEALALAALFATHAALALAEAQRADQLRSAIDSRDLIGQAKGILMERHRLSADESFSLLVKASQRQNRKLIDIARELTATGVLPGQQPEG